VYILSKIPICGQKYSEISYFRTGKILSQSTITLILRSVETPTSICYRSDLVDSSLITLCIARGVYCVVFACSVCALCTVHCVQWSTSNGTVDRKRIVKWANELVDVSQWTSGSKAVKYWKWGNEVVKVRQWSSGSEAVKRWKCDSEL